MSPVFCDNEFYLHIEPRHNSPLTAIPQSDSDSRIVDVIYRNRNANADGNAHGTANSYDTTCKTEFVRDAQELENSLGQRIRPTNGDSGTSLDRLYYENNWPYMRSLLCRKYVKGIFENAANTNLESAEEEIKLMKYQMFLNSSSQRKDLTFSYFGPGATSLHSVIVGQDRLLYHFGFDWVVVPKVIDDSPFKKLDSGGSNLKCLVRRRTCVASILKLSSTEKLHSVAEGALPWDSTAALLHRRTVILFNELHSNKDGLRFKEWLASSDLWEVSGDSNTGQDDEKTAILFLYRLTCQIWESVIAEWKIVVDHCSVHIKTSELRLLEKQIDPRGLEDLAQTTWLDSHDWSKLGQLISHQRQAVSKAEQTLSAVSTQVEGTTTDEKARIDRILAEFTELNSIISVVFPQRGQNISNLIYNIIGVRNAQAAEDYNTEIGAITWITFIFFPLITVSGLFGMNVDVLADNPSIKWYFIITIPLMVLVILIAMMIRGRKKIKRIFSRNTGFRNVLV
ncbi:hypothetical protein MMC32_005495 [Xylographa parallela]|nr:hypothetical protein [Xylographa parallela]